MNGRRGPRQFVFVCAAIDKNGELYTKIVPALNQADASEIFKNKFLMDARDVLGPFFKKKIKAIENTKVFKLSNEIKQASYNDWLVNAFMLKEPENQAFLVFLKRTDGKKTPTPKGTIIVPISDLRFL